MNKFNVFKGYMTFSFRNFYTTSRRCVLSPSYHCKEIWTERLQQDVLSKIDVDSFGSKVFEKMELEEEVSAVDMDLLANKVEYASDKMKDFFMEVYARYRKFPQAKDMPESTPYAIVRFLFENEEYDTLLDTLKKKIKYGVFLDEHLTNMALEGFIKGKDYERAAKIAYEMMLQEGVGDHPISTALMWKACHYHWKTGEHAHVTHHEDDPNDEDIRYIRKDYLPTPYYDDHFDIPHDVWKLGKSFVALTEGNSGIKHLSYRLIGWALYDKYDKAIELLQSVLNNSDQAVTPIAMSTVFSRLEGVVTKEPPAEPKVVGLQTVADYYPFITAKQKEEYLETLKDLADKLNSANKVQEFDLEESVETHAKETISQHEAEYTKLHEIQLKQWEEERNKNFQTEIETIKRNLRKRAVGEKLREMHIYEEKLRFFEDTKRVSRSIARAGRSAKAKFPRAIYKTPHIEPYVRNTQQKTED